MIPACARCGGGRTIKNGHIHNGKQRYLCRDCGRQFVEAPAQQPVSKATRELIDRLLCERLPLAGVCRAVGVSESWLQEYVNEKYENVPRRAELAPRAGAAKRGVAARH